MRVLTFIPSVDNPSIQHISGAPGTIERIMGGPIAMQRLPNIMPDAILIYNANAQTPNRIVDGHAVNGVIMIVRIKNGELASLPLNVAERVRDNCKRPQPNGLGCGIIRGHQEGRNIN